MKYDLELLYKFDDAKRDPSDGVDALYEAGLTDALIGTGLRGGVGVATEIEAETREAAIDAITAMVRSVFPDAKLTGAGDAWPELPIAPEENGERKKL